MTWIGWLCLKNGDWERVCKAEGLHECALLLLDEFSRRSMTDTLKRCLTSGAYPKPLSRLQSMKH